MESLYKKFAQDLGDSTVGLVLYVTGHYERKATETDKDVLDPVIFERAVQAVHFARLIEQEGTEIPLSITCFCDNPDVTADGICRNCGNDV